MLIRRARKEDIPALARIELEHPGFPAWGEKGLRAEFEKNFSVTLVAESAARVGGFVNFWILKAPVRPAERAAEDAPLAACAHIQLNSLAVSVPALKNGMASALLDKVAEYAAKNVCAEIDLEVSERNTPAIRLYEKSGFKETGRRPKFYNNTDDAILMRKTIWAKK